MHLFKYALTFKTPLIKKNQVQNNVAGHKKEKHKEERKREKPNVKESTIQM